MGFTFCVLICPPGPMTSSSRPSSLYNAQNAGSRMSSVSSTSHTRRRGGVVNVKIFKFLDTVATTYSALHWALNSGISHGSTMLGRVYFWAITYCKPAGAGAKFDGGGRLGTPPSAFVRMSHPWQLAASVRTTHP